MKFYKTVEENQGKGDPLLVICEYELYNILLYSLAEKQNLKGFEVYRNSLLVNKIIDKIKKEKLKVPFEDFESYIEEAIGRYKKRGN